MKHEDMKMSRFFAITILIIATLLYLATCEAQAQTLESSIGRVEVGPDYVSYVTPERTETVPRDILQVLPRSGRYQHVADDLALLIDKAVWEGAQEPNWTPAADDSVIVLLDSLQATATLAASEIQRLRAQVATLQAENANLKAENLNLIAERDAAVQDAQVFRGLVSSITRQVIAILNEQ